MSLVYKQHPKQIFSLESNSATTCVYANNFYLNDYLCFFHAVLPTHILSPLPSTSFLKSQPLIHTGPISLRERRHPSKLAKFGVSQHNTFLMVPLPLLYLPGRSAWVLSLIKEVLSLACSWPVATGTHSRWPCVTPAQDPPPPRHSCCRKLYSWDTVSICSTSVDFSFVNLSSIPVGWHGILYSIYPYPDLAQNVPDTLFVTTEFWS